LPLIYIINISLAIDITRFIIDYFITIYCHYFFRYMPLLILLFIFLHYQIRHYAIIGWYWLIFTEVFRHITWLAYIITSLLPRPGYILPYHYIAIIRRLRHTYVIYFIIIISYYYFHYITLLHYFIIDTLLITMHHYFIAFIIISILIFCFTYYFFMADYYYYYCISIAAIHMITPLHAIDCFIMHYIITFAIFIDYTLAAIQ